MLTWDSCNRKANELNEISHLYLWYDKQYFSLWTTGEVFLSSKKILSSIPVPTGHIQNSDSTKNLRNTPKKPRSTGPAFFEHPVQFFLCSLLIYFYSRDWWCRRIIPILKQHSFLHHVRKPHYINCNFRYPLKASDLKCDPRLQHAVSKKMQQMYTY